MKNVEELTGNINLSETREYSEVRKGYTYFQDGDIIFAKNYGRAWKMEKLQ